MNSAALGSGPPAAPRSSLADLFVRHPRELGMSWAVHGRGAVLIGFRLITAGAACFIHAIVPGWFTETAGRAVRSLNHEMTSRRATSANPSVWPEYEI